MFWVIHLQMLTDWSRNRRTELCLNFPDSTMTEEKFRTDFDQPTGQRISGLDREVKSCIGWQTRKPISSGLPFVWDSVRQFNCVSDRYSYQSFSRDEIDLKWSSQEYKWKQKSCDIIRKSDLKFTMVFSLVAAMVGLHDVSGIYLRKARFKTGTIMTTWEDLILY